MSVKWWEEKAGHASSRRIFLGVVFALATFLAVNGLAMAWGHVTGRFPNDAWIAVIGSGTGLIAGALPIMQWGKTLDKKDTQ